MKPFDVTHEGRGLKQILEDNSIVKVWFDARNDIDAILHIYNVEPVNALCLQLAEVAHHTIYACVIEYVDDLLSGVLVLHNKIEKPCL
jgi:ribonuclease D